MGVHSYLNCGFDFQKQDNHAPWPLLLGQLNDAYQFPDMVGITKRVMMAFVSEEGFPVIMNGSIMEPGENADVIDCECTAYWVPDIAITPNLCNLLDAIIQPT